MEWAWCFNVVLSFHVLSHLLAVGLSHPMCLRSSCRSCDSSAVESTEIASVSTCAVSFFRGHCCWKWGSDVDNLDMLKRFAILTPVKTMLYTTPPQRIIGMSRQILQSWEIPAELEVNAKALSQSAATFMPAPNIRGFSAIFCKCHNGALSCQRTDK